MAHRKLEHDDMALFRNRLWKLMERKSINTAKELATTLFEAGLVTVKQKPNFNPPEINKANAIGSVEKKIQAHLNAENPDRLQGEYVMAYCEFFRCSADYLFGRTDVVSCNNDVRRFCESTGLSEKAVKRLIEDLPEDAKANLTQWWSEVLESALFYGLPIGWHEMCFALGQYYKSQNVISSIHKATESMDSSDKYTATFGAMMTDNYTKEAKIHEASYFYHLNSITTNMAEFLEKSAETYAIHNKQRIDAFFSKQLQNKLRAKPDLLDRPVDEQKAEKKSHHLAMKG